MTIRPEIRTGLGYDVHRLQEGRRLVIGGVAIDHPKGLLGHSDADILTHAVIDALLGAAGADDIGTHFPDTDERFKDADSLDLLVETAGILSERGWLVSNIDATVVIEAPKLAPHRELMRENIAKALGVDAGRINVKATRGEGMGFVGRSEGAAAMAVATLCSTG